MDPSATAGRSICWRPSPTGWWRRRDARPSRVASRVPPAPGPRAIEPLLRRRQNGTPLIRCHDVRFGATEFNPGLGAGRFHPFEDARSGNPVPVLYAAGDLDGALSETVFHDVAVRGAGKKVERFMLEA